MAEYGDGYCDGWAEGYAEGCRERDAALKLARMIADWHEESVRVEKIVSQANTLLNKSRSALEIADDALYTLTFRSIP